MSCKFVNPWPSIKAVDKQVIDLWFEEFSIRKNFEGTCSRRLKDIFGDARKKNVKLQWLSDAVWRGLKEYWGSEEFKKKREKARQNHASDVGGLGTSIHTGGSIPMTEHKHRLEQKAGKEVGAAELFKATHQRKDSAWVDRRAAETYEKFTNTCEEMSLSQETEDSSLIASQDKLWATSNKTSKGSIYGLGALGSSIES